MRNRFVLARPATGHRPVVFIVDVVRMCAKLIVTTGLLCPVVLAGGQEKSGQPIALDSRSSLDKPVAALKKLTPLLRMATNVPPRLPTALPYAEQEHPIFVNPDSVDESHYALYLGWLPWCEGENVCAYGSLYGGSTKFQFPHNEGRPPIEAVELVGGIKGEFLDAECSLHCTESYLRWSEGAYSYAIGLKGGRKDVLLRVANLAIKAGRAHYANEQTNSAQNTNRARPILDGSTLVKEVERQLRDRTEVPLRLPLALPTMGRYPFYVTVKSIGMTGYDVMLTTKKDCQSENICFFSSLSGSAVGWLKSGGEKRVFERVRIQKGLDGYFSPSFCGETCDQAIVQWCENGFYYSLSLADPIAAVVEMARSATREPIPVQISRPCRAPSFNSPTSETAASLLGGIAGKLTQSTKIPVRLPVSGVPTWIGKHQIFAILHAVDSAHYQVLLAVTPDCKGESNCIYGSIEGSNSRLMADRDPEESSTPIRLNGEKVEGSTSRWISGNFIEPVCRATCGLAFVRWKQDGFYYSIGLKTLNRDSILAMANSAAATGAAN